MPSFRKDYTTAVKNAIRRTETLCRRLDGFHKRVCGLDADYFNRECTYAIIETDGTLMVKLGRTAGHPSQRLADLQTGNPRKLLLLAYTFHLIEPQVHRRWRRLRIGGEWFRLDRGLLLELKTWDWLDGLLFVQLAERLRLTVSMGWFVGAGEIETHPPPLFITPRRKREARIINAGHYKQLEPVRGPI